MGVKVIERKYGAPTHNILAMPDHYVAIARKFTPTDSAAVTVGSRKIIKAGTIYPTNDASAIGVILQDIDVTDGDKTDALVIHGFILTEKIPTAATDEAKAALPLIKFMDKVDNGTY